MGCICDKVDNKEIKNELETNVRSDETTNNDARDVTTGNEKNGNENKNTLSSPGNEPSSTNRQIGGVELTEPQKEQLLSYATYDTTPYPTYTFTRAKVIKVYDGDTMWVAAFHHNQLVKFSARLYGVDCAEMKDKRDDIKKLATEAKKFVIGFCYNKIVDISVLNGLPIGGSKKQVYKELYGRLLVRISVNGKDLADELLRLNLAKRYFGGHKSEW